jgi:hypothetical protein
MAVVMIQCPKTGQAISTGLCVDPEHFGRMPVFISRSYCAFCAAEHEWFAKDAWVQKPQERPRSLRCEAA